MDPLDPRKLRDVENEMRACLDFIRALPIPDAQDFERGCARRRHRGATVDRIRAQRKSD